MPQTAGTVLKALALLDEFLDGTAQISLREMTARSGMNKTTVLRLCASLEAAGFLEHTSGAAYRLGPKIWQLGQTYRRGFRLEDMVRRQLLRLRDETGESSSFCVAEGREQVCRFRENSRLVVRHHVEEGTRMPLGSGASGRVLLAYTRARGADLEAIRKNRYLVAQGHEPHTTSVAVPVIDGCGILHGALMVSGPSIRFAGDAPRMALKLLQSAAAEIAQSLPTLEMEQPRRGKIVAAPAMQPAGTSAKASGTARPQPKTTQFRAGLAKKSSDHPGL